MKSLLILLCSLVVVSSLFSHPSWGIVVTTEGIVYFVDVLHNGDGTLWQFDPNTEELTAVKTWFHSHNVIMASDGEIYVAVAIWRSGEIEGEGINYLFQFDPASNDLDTLIETRDWDVFYGNDFAINRNAERVYFPMNGKIHHRDIASDHIETIPHKFDRYCTMAFDADDQLWITDSRHKNGTIFRWTPEQGVREVASNIFPLERNDAIFDNPAHHLFYGIGFSKEGIPLICENVERSLWEIGADGSKIKRYQSKSNWHPSGLYYHNEAYYLIEHGFDKVNLGPRLVILNEEFEILKEFDFAF